jgi:membrane protease YdiL (CAAX protease family)
MTNPKGVIAYLILAFGIAWVSWEIPVRMLHLDVTSPQFQLYALPGAFAPAIAAVLVRLFGGEGFKGAGLKLPIFSKWPYFLFALLLPLLIIAAMVFEAQGLGFAPAGFDLSSAIRGVAPSHEAAGQAATAAKLAQIGPWLIPTLLGAAILSTPVLWGEEFGWRGYLQPRLFPGRPVVAAIVTGVIWAAWHFPLILRGYDYGPEQAVIGCGALIVSAILLSFVFAWLVDRTGSIWSSSLAHAATNGVGGSLTILWFGSHNLVVTSYAGALAWPPFLVVCLAILMFGRRRKPVSAAAEAA